MLVYPRVSKQYLTYSHLYPWEKRHECCGVNFVFVIGNSEITELGNIVKSEALRLHYKNNAASRKLT